MAQHAIIDTVAGKLRGTVAAGVLACKGVRYAAPPVGAQRFRPPGPLEPWSDVKDALEFGARSLQFENAFPVAPEIRPLIAGYLPEASSEDCLYLNVWAPVSWGPDKLPVMVWLHGGAFTSGCGAQPWTDGANLAAAGAVVVTVNHRLGALGYLHLEDIAGPEFAGTSMNGMLDIVAALRWVRDNIAAFGGDMANVTLFGQSGGGAKISVLMAMPQARGLFHKAIIQSGPAVRMADRDDGSANARTFLQELQLEPRDAHRLRSLPAQDLLQAQIAILTRASLASFAERRRRGFNPVVGTAALPSGPFEPEAPALSDRVPLMIGTTKDEMTIFYALAPWFAGLDEAGLRERVRAMAGERGDAVIDAYKRARPGDTPGQLLIAISGDQGVRMPSLLMADRKLARRATPVFVYSLECETPVLGGRLGSPHVWDVPLVFNQLAAAPIAAGFDTRHQALADTLMRSWVAFARNGDPNGAGLPHWPAYTPERPTMMLDAACHVAADPRGAERLAWS
jgi:para-nitrobenzyl esterase